MQFFIDNWMLISVAFASGAMLLWPVVQGATSGGLSAASAVQLINRERAVVVDVCEAEEFAAGHVGGAKNVPVGQLERRLPEVVKNKTRAADPGVRQRRPGQPRSGRWPRNWVTTRPKYWAAG